LNHLLHSHEKLTAKNFSHYLVLLSLENLCLQTASSAPVLSFVKPAASPLLYDHPFDLKIVPDESSVVPFSESESESSNTPTKPSSYKLQVEGPPKCLEDYSVLEVFDLNGLVQELRSLQFTHPYVEIFKHQHSESIILVVHTGFDGTPVHTHQLSSHTHTTVGFQNYLRFVCQRYGHLIDEAAEEDKAKSLEYEEEKEAIAAQKLLKEAVDRHKAMLTTVDEEPVQPSNGKARKSGGSIRGGGGGGSISKQAKKSTISTGVVESPVSSLHNLHADSTLQPPKPQKRFTGYDMGDVVLLKKSAHTTLFTSDGVQVQSKRHTMTDGEPEPCDISLLHNGHRVICTQVLAPPDPSSTSTDAGTNLPTDEVVIPQPPPQLKFATLKACFNESLHISCSHYGPKGNGELPYLPYRPKILDRQPSDHLQPTSTQTGASPKLSKKQQEHQQQLLEQQRVLEAQLEKERQIARVKYQQEFDILARNYKHQQLSVSTEYGLKVQCHVSLNCETDTADAFQADTASVIIKQQYSQPTTVAQLNEPASKERCRFYLSDGYVIKCMLDNSVTILSADGTRYCTASAKEAEMFSKHKSSTGSTLSPVKPLQEPDKIEIEKAARKVSSVTKLKSAEKDKPLPPPVPVPSTPQSKVWSITTSSGNRYLFEVAEETETQDLDPEPPLTPEPENKENIDPSPTAADTQKNYVVLPLSPIHLLKATDPVTKEVGAVTRFADTILLFHVYL
jgi:hypothetical protein